MPVQDADWPEGLRENIWFQSLGPREADLVRIVYKWRPMSSFDADGPEVLVDVCLRLV